MARLYDSHGSLARTLSKLLLFTGIDSSSDIAVSSHCTQLIYSFVSFFNLFIYFIVIANILFFKLIAWNLLSQIPYSVSVISVSAYASLNAAMLLLFEVTLNIETRRQKKCLSHWSNHGLRPFNVKRRLWTIVFTMQMTTWQQ